MKLNDTEHLFFDYPTKLSFIKRKNASPETSEEAIRINSQVDEDDVHITYVPTPDETLADSIRVAIESQRWLIQRHLSGYPVVV
jgi:hypothetical protein